MNEFIERIEISAPPEVVWAVLWDIGNIYRWNPGVKHSRQTSAGEVSIGATRFCDLGGKNYLQEEVVAAEALRTVTFRITQTNLPFRHADIRFTLAPDGTNTVVTLSPGYQLKFGIVGQLMDKFIVRNRYRMGMQRLLQGLKAHVEARSSD